MMGCTRTEGASCEGPFGERGGVPRVTVVHDPEEHSCDEDEGIVEDDITLVQVTQQWWWSEVIRV